LLMPQHVLAIVDRPSQDALGTPGAEPWRFVDPASPQLTTLDLGATRGDGIFESLSVGHGRAQALDHHLRRFAHSAAMLELPAPDLELWRRVILATIDELATPGEAFVIIVMARGIE